MIFYVKNFNVYTDDGLKCLRTSFQHYDTIRVTYTPIERRSSQDTVYKALNNLGHTASSFRKYRNLTFWKIRILQNRKKIMIKNPKL